MGRNHKNRHCVSAVWMADLWGPTRKHLKLSPMTSLNRSRSPVQPLGDLQLDQERTDIDLGADDLFQTLGWFETGMSLAQGNRVVMSVVQSQVSNVIVVRDLAN